MGDHVVGDLGLWVVLESESPFVVIATFAFVYGEIGSLQILGVAVEIPIAALETAGAADLCRFLFIVRIVGVLQVLGHGWMGGHTASLAVSVAKHVLFGAVVALEGALATPQEEDEQRDGGDQQSNAADRAADGSPGTVVLQRDLAVLRRREVREFWEGKDRWKGRVCQCSGGKGGALCRCSFLDEEGNTG